MSRSSRSNDSHWESNSPSWWSLPSSSRSSVSNLSRLQNPSLHGSNVSLFSTTSSTLSVDFSTMTDKELHHYIRESDHGIKYYIDKFSDQDFTGDDFEYTTWMSENKLSAGPYERRLKAPYGTDPEYPPCPEPVKLAKQVRYRHRRARICFDLRSIAPKITVPLELRDAVQKGRDYITTKRVISIAVTQIKIKERDRMQGVPSGAHIAITGPNFEVLYEAIIQHHEQKTCKTLGKDFHGLTPQMLEYGRKIEHVRKDVFRWCKWADVIVGAGLINQFNALNYTGSDVDHFSQKFRDVTYYYSPVENTGINLPLIVYLQTQMVINARKYNCIKQSTLAMLMYLLEAEEIELTGEERMTKRGAIRYWFTHRDIQLKINEKTSTRHKLA